MLIKKFIVFLLFTVSVVVCATNETEPEELKKEIDQLKSDLQHLQNTTISLFKDYTVKKNTEYQCRDPQDLIEQKIIAALLSIIINSSTTRASLDATAIHQKLTTLQDLMEQTRNDFLSLNSSMTVVKSEVTALDQKIDSARLSFNSTCDITPTSLPLGSFLNPAASCKNIPTSSPSGNYWIQSTSTGYATMEYCDMSPPFNHSRASGWMKLAQLDMTDPQEHCPSGFRTITTPKRVCGTSSGPVCTSTTFSVNGVHYGKVCGKVIGYQYYSMDAFAAFNRDRSRTIDDVYVDGVSLTHGQSPRQHIWTFTNAIDETRSTDLVCPCSKADSTFTGVVPPFIGSDYFCDTGSRYTYANQWYTADPLWDGEGCGGSSTCCEFNNPPWFCKDLPQTTTDDIELRLCHDETFSNEDIGIELVEIYVQ